MNKKIPLGGMKEYLKNKLSKEKIEAFENNYYIQSAKEKIMDTPLEEYPVCIFFPDKSVDVGDGLSWTTYHREPLFEEWLDYEGLKWGFKDHSDVYYIYADL